MAFDFAATKSKARQVLHDTLAVSALYQDSTLVEPVSLRVRFHTKINRFGDLVEQGWAEVIEGVNRLIFNIPELTEKGVIPRNGATVSLAAPFDGVVLVLHVEEPGDGIVSATWQVSKE